MERRTFFSALLFASFLIATNAENRPENDSIEVKNGTNRESRALSGLSGSSGVPAGGRSARKFSVNNFVICGITREVGCFLDVAQDFLDDKRNEILDQADSRALKFTGRADEQPSHLSVTINKLLTDFMEVFKDSFGGWFKSSRESDEEEEVEEAGDDDEDDEGDEESGKNTKVAKGRSRETARKKKKKKGKLLALIKLVIIAVIIAIKVILILKALSAALQVKFFLVALAGLLLNAARFWIDLKKGHQPQKVIYYEHAQHQHHYEDGAEDWESSAPGGGSGGYWGRSYDENEQHAQNLAYAKQKPAAQALKGSTSSLGSSWFG